MRSFLWFAFLCVVVLGQTEIYKSNFTGNCDVDNTNCDFAVGIWNLNVHLNAYSVNYASGAQLPFGAPEDTLCTNPYTIPAICIFGYREENGNLTAICYFAETFFDGTGNGNAGQRTATFNYYGSVSTFAGGMNYISLDGLQVCDPVQFLSTDSVVQNPFAGFPGTSSGISCPSAPLGEIMCEEGSSFRTFSSGRRRVPFDRDNGYFVAKNLNRKGLCNIQNSNCDLFAGSWDGFIIMKAYSAKYDIPDESIFPETAEDVLCAIKPFIVPYTCENGYSTNTGEFIQYCFWDSTRIVTDSSGSAFLSQPHSSMHIIDSLYNGIRWQGIDYESDGLSEDENSLMCTPMDWVDSNTVTIQLYAPYNPPSVQPNCTSANLSPNFNVQCCALEDTECEGVVNVAYAVLARQVGVRSAGSLISLSPIITVLFMVFLYFGH